MSHYICELQHTGKPFKAEPIPETAWKLYSRHTSRRAALYAKERATKHMIARCGLHAWDDTFRLVALEDIPMRIVFVCLGYGAEFHCPDSAMAFEAVIWEKGTEYPRPVDHIPEGWGSAGQCSACAKRQQEYERSLI